MTEKSQGRRKVAPVIAYMYYFPFENREASLAADMV